jgi:magnesium-protoporphyrin O-methyltransferase
MLLTFAPRTAALTVMHAVGRLFPRGDRAPAIEPVRHRTIVRHMDRETEFLAWRTARTHRVARGFYISQALEIVPR